MLALFVTGFWGLEGLPHLTHLTTSKMHARRARARAACPDPSLSISMSRSASKTPSDDVLSTLADDQDLNFLACAQSSALVANIAAPFRIRRFVAPPRHPPVAATAARALLHATLPRQSRRAAAAAACLTAAVRLEHSHASCSRERARGL